MGAIVRAAGEVVNVQDPTRRTTAFVAEIRTTPGTGSHQVCSGNRTPANPGTLGLRGAALDVRDEYGPGSRAVGLPQLVTGRMSFTSRVEAAVPWVRKSDSSEHG